MEIRTFEVGVPSTLKLPCPFFVRAGLRVVAFVTPPVAGAVLFVARDVDGLGVVVLFGI